MTCGFGLLKTKEEIPFMIMNYRDIDTSHVHIICRDGVLVEGHTARVLLLCTSLMDVEADCFGKLIGLLLLMLTFDVCCRTQYVRSFKLFHQFHHVNLLKKLVR